MMGVPAWMTNEESQTDSLDELQHAMGEGEIYTKELVQQEQCISTYHVGSSMHGSKGKTDSHATQGHEVHVDCSSAPGLSPTQNLQSSTLCQVSTPTVPGLRH